MLCLLITLFCIAPALALSLIFDIVKVSRTYLLSLGFIHFAFLTPSPSSWPRSLSQIVIPQTLPTSHIYLAASPEKSPLISTMI